MVLTKKRKTFQQIVLIKSRNEFFTTSDILVVNGLSIAILGIDMELVNYPTLRI